MSAFFPSSVATSLNLLTAVNNLAVVLGSNCAVGDTTIILSDASGLPASGYLTFIDTDEVIYYSSISGNDLIGVTRGADNTAAAAHIAGVDLEPRWNAEYHNRDATELIAVEQYLSDRFGIGSSPVIPNGKTLAVGGSADSKSILTLTSTTLGFLPPRMTTTQRDAITSPTQGLGIYNSTTNHGNVYDGTAWRQIVLAGVAEIVNADINASAAIAYSKLTLTGSIVNADVNASAAIAHSKMAALTISRALVSDSSGIVSVATTTATEIGYVNGVTSAIQTQLGTKAAIAGQQFTGNISFDNYSTHSIVGTATNDSPPAGNVGEVISSSVGSGGGVSLSTTVGKTITSINLTAGDWDVFGQVGFSPAGTVNNFQASSSQTNNTLGAEQATITTTYASATTLSILLVEMAIPTVVVKVAITTTLYLVVTASFASTCTGWGTITGRRRR